MRTFFLTVTSLSLLGLSGCWLDGGSTEATADSGAGEDSQIAGSDTTAGTDAATTDVTAGTDVASAGCTVGDTSCGAGSYCSAPEGQCTGKGTCAKRPEACPAIYGPICGCDGKDYGNGCEANAAGVVMNTGGSCKAATTKWYTTCGAPVCSGPKADPSLPACTTQKEGDACAPGAVTCDLVNACQQHLICADKDPKTGAGGCPISRRSKKTDIRYLDANDVAKLQSELLATKLATYKYRDAGPQAPQQLGFIIDDQPNSPAVDAKRDMVDLYGYLSMSVAALQVQQRQLTEQAKRIEQLEKALRNAPICQ